MNPLLHALNIGTLANWLSVTLFGAVALAVSPWRTVAPAPPAEDLGVAIEEVNLGEMTAAEPDSWVESGEPSEVPPPPEEIVPAPPELPEIAEFSPLPELPDLPAPAVKPAPQPAETQPAPRPSPRKSTAASSTSGRPATATGRPGSSAATGMSDAARLASGRMPAPSYPAAARRAGQTGTVMIEFTVDASGRVISAYAKSPSPWPLLNEEAVRTVRRWKFPAGGVMKLQRPIVFQLR